MSYEEEDTSVCKTKGRRTCSSNPPVVCVCVYVRVCVCVCVYCFIDYFVYFGHSFIDYLICYLQHLRLVKPHVYTNRNTAWEAEGGKEGGKGGRQGRKG